jgi:hypothetical protein
MPEIPALRRLRQETLSQKTKHRFPEHVRKYME